MAKDLLFNSKVLTSTSFILALFSIDSNSAFGKDVINQITLKQLNNSPLRMD